MSDSSYLSDDSDEMRNISRINQPERNTIGWYVRLSRQGKRYQKFFADKKYPSKWHSLEAAQDFRDQLEKELPGRMPRHESALRAVASRSDNPVLGIRFVVKERRKSGKVYEGPYVEARRPGQPNKARAWSLNSRSNAKAVWNACVYRARHEGLDSQAVQKMHEKALPYINRKLRDYLKEQGL